MSGEPDPVGIPLPASQFHILLALADGEKHGYAVMREIDEMTEGQVTMGPGTVYGTIRRLLELGLIEEADERPDPELDDSRRRYYRATSSGLVVLTAETERMARLVRTAGIKSSGQFKPRLEGI